MDKVRLNSLTIKYLLGTLTEEEQRELDKILDEDPLRRQRFQQRVDRARLQKDLALYLTITKSASRTVSIRRYLPYAAAAAVLLAILTTLWLSRNKTTEPAPETPPIALQQDIQPGSTRATLTLSDGAVIDLDSAGKGPIASQGGSKIFKTDSGRIAYKAAAGTAAYNLVATPRGGTFQVALPDGSVAWLNAASSIRFPTIFRDRKREVEITGEVYFDIARDAAKPFYVKSAAATVEVLGTAFDVQAYPNEPAMQVSLVNGSIRLQAQGRQLVLSPGQQARLTSETPMTLVDHPDIDGATAWRSGFFKLKDADIRQIMRGIERWYNVDVEYQIGDYSMRYGGRISRDLPLSQLLRLLEANHIHHYRIEGKKLIVLP